MEPTTPRQRPPSVDAVARRLAELSDLPSALLVDVARTAIRHTYDGVVDTQSVVAHAVELTSELNRSLLQPVINATGVLLHTNLGRAPLAVEQAACYGNLELDLESGRRGSRSMHAARLVAKLCGAQDALVVNNGASAVLLMLAALARDSEVIVSRGELIEIGGGFRIPEILASSGASLVEVGTTNRTRLSDYSEMVSEDTAMLLKVHTSNYRLVGFTETASIRELAGLADSALPQQSRRIIVAMDIGSGLLDEDCPWIPGGPPSWIADEPGAKQTLRAGADLVTFSGDKLFGGPQAGFIVGKAPFVEACRRHPLARALRPGHLVLAALQHAALSYLRRDAVSTIPLWRMANTPARAIRTRAEALGVGRVVSCESVMGGGSLPGRSIPSFGVALEGDWTAKLRRFRPPVIARIVGGDTVCDLRTVFADDDAVLAKLLKI